MAHFDPRNYQTYTILAPLSTHWRKATCAEVDCPDYLNGWRTRVEYLTPEQLHLARNCGRRHIVVKVGPGETYLVYDAGQPCFQVSTHRMRLEREERYLIRDGDARGNPTGRRVEVSGTAWNDDFGEHQQRLADLQQEG